MILEKKENGSSRTLYRNMIIFKHIIFNKIKHAHGKFHAW